MQLMVVRKDIEVAEKYVDFVQERFNRGITNELDVTLAQRELAQLQAQVAPLAAQIDAARYVIAVLIGEFPENLGKRAETAGRCCRRCPAASGPVCRSISCAGGPTSSKPSGNWRAPPRQIGVATANLFPAGGGDRPAVGQQAAIGAASRSTRSGRSGRRSPCRSLDFGRLDAVVEKADFRTRELLSNYKQTVLNAVREVDTAVDAYAAQQDRLRHLDDALIAARRAVSLAQQRFDRGLDRFAQCHRRPAAGIRDRAAIRDGAGKRRGAIRDAVQIARRRLGGLSIFPPIPPPLPAVAAAFRSLLAPDRPSGLSTPLDETGLPGLLTSTLSVWVSGWPENAHECRGGKGISGRVRGIEGPKICRRRAALQKSF